MRDNGITGAKIETGTDIPQGRSMYIAKKDEVAEKKMEGNRYKVIVALPSIITWRTEKNHRKYQTGKSQDRHSKPWPPKFKIMQIT